MADVTARVVALLPLAADVETLHLQVSPSVELWGHVNRVLLALVTRPMLAFQRDGEDGVLDIEGLTAWLGPDTELCRFALSEAEKAKTGAMRGLLRRPDNRWNPSFAA